MSSWLKKLIVAEDEENNNISAQITPSYQEEPVEIPSNIDLSQLVSIDQIYNTSNLGDTSKSIFKVEDFLQALPASLPSDVRRQSVISILTASGLDVNSLLLDATQRTDLLSKVQEAFNQDTEEIINSAELTIKDLESEIDKLKRTINDRKKLQEMQLNLIKEEVDKIDKIVNFISPS